MTRVAVTGASGFIGQSLMSSLYLSGFDVVAVSRSSLPSSHCVAAHYHPGNYLNTDLLVEAFSGCSVVFHLASLAHRSYLSCTQDALVCFREANVAPLVSVARAAILAKVKRVVFLSSIGVNGSCTFGTPFTDSDQPRPSEPYAISKFEAEQALSKELLGTNTDWVVLRPPLVYGPGCPGNLRRLIQLASWAPVLPFGSISSSRTLISIFNLIDALLLSSDHPAVSRRVFVISDSEDIDVAGILQAFLLGLGRGSWRLVPFPPFLIAFFMKLLGRNSLWLKFSCELRVDSSSFCSATGWFPVVRPHYGLRSAASSTLRS